MHAGRDFPQDPREQMDLAVHAVFRSWNADRAILYRRQERIPADLGTAVNVVAMVFGNLGMDSGTGVAFTRDPGTGQQGVYGDYLQNAQGEDVVAGIRNTVPLQDLEQIDPASYAAADGDHADPGEPLPGPVRHRVHHRARQALDAADPGRQAHRRGRVPDRHPARGPGPDRHGRGGHPGHRRPARPADVPPVRPQPGAEEDHHRGQRLPGRRGRQGRVRLRDAPSSRPTRARTSSWSAARPTPTTCTA